MWTAQKEHWNRCPGDPGNSNNLWHIPKDFVTTIKKGGRKDGTCLAVNGWYFEKENVKCATSGSEDDVSQ